MITKFIFRVTWLLYTMHVYNDGSENSQQIAKKFVAVSVIMNMKENFTIAISNV